jgi:hypothetical protein
LDWWRVGFGARGSVSHSLFYVECQGCSEHQLLKLRNTSVPSANALFIRPGDHPMLTLINIGGENNVHEMKIVEGVWLQWTSVKLLDELRWPEK